MPFEYSTGKGTPYNREDFDVQGGIPARSDFQMQDRPGVVEEGTPQTPLSISQYLDQIRQLRAQQAAAGVPPEQRAVPTFSNVQGGPLDVMQGRLKGGQPVRSYVSPEYRETPGGMGAVERGPAHRVTRAENKLSQNMGQVVKNDLHPQWADAVSLQSLPEAVNAYEQNVLGNQRQASQEEIMAVARSLREQAAREQEKIIKRYKSLYGIEGKEIFDAIQSGDIDTKNLFDKIESLRTEDRAGKVYSDALKEARKDYAEGTRLQDVETGEYFDSPEDYANDAVRDYLRGLENMKKSLEDISQAKMAIDQKPKKPLQIYLEEKKSGDRIGANLLSFKGRGRVVRTGTYKGKPVVQYEDGSIETIEERQDRYR